MLLFIVSRQTIKFRLTHKKTERHKIEKSNLKLTVNAFIFIEMQFIHVFIMYKINIEETMSIAHIYKVNHDIFV